MPSSLDRTDRALLAALQDNARLTISELADQVALTTSPCWRRVKLLEDNGYITGYQAILSPKSLGFGVTAFVSIMMDSHTKDMALAFEQRLMEIPRSLLATTFLDGMTFVGNSGEGSGVVWGIYREVLQRLPGVEIYSSFSYKAVKEKRVIPVSEIHI